MLAFGNHPTCSVKCGSAELVDHLLLQSEQHITLSLIVPSFQQTIRQAMHEVIVHQTTA